MMNGHTCSPVELFNPVEGEHHAVRMDSDWCPGRRPRAARLSSRPPRGGWPPHSRPIRPPLRHNRTLPSTSEEEYERLQRSADHKTTMSHFLPSPLTEYPGATQAVPGSVPTIHLRDTRLIPVRYRLQIRPVPGASLYSYLQEEPALHYVPAGSLDSQKSEERPHPRGRRLPLRSWSLPRESRHCAGRGLPLKLSKRVCPVLQELALLRSLHVALPQRFL